MEMPIDTRFTSDGFATVATWLSTQDTRRVLLLCGPNRRFVDAALAALGAFDVDVFDGARAHVPADVVERATVRMHDVDAIVALGGGSPIGLGKALRRAHPSVRFVVVPTTYAGSEMTTMFGITQGADKQTGRDPRVRPDLVVYDTSLARDMPIGLTVQSLLNSFAHCASIEAGYDAARDVLRAIEDLLQAPRASAARERAARAASACAQAFERGTPGLQHALAHLLGGALRTPHAPLHAILLPHFLAHQRTLGKLAALEDAVDRGDLDAYVHDLLVRAGAPVSLVAVGGTLETVRAALATRPELPGKLVLDALVGLRPPGRGGRVLLGDREAVVIGALAEATTVVLALHGRGAEAGTIARRYREIAGDDPEVAIVGLCAGEAMDRWYAIRYGEPGAGSDAGVVAALEVVAGAVAALALLAPGARVVLAGFSQGACLALEYAARHGDLLAAVIAPCGARIGQPAEWAPSTGGFAGAVVLGAADADAWIARADVEATAAWFRAAGAQVDVVDGPGARHEITPRQRLRAREVILGRLEPRGVGGFGATLEAEALAGALPAHLNSPRIPPFGLYAEQLNATGFTAPRAENLRTWCYRVRPASQRRPFAPLQGARVTGTFGLPPMIELAGFAPLALDGERDFVDGLVTLCGAGDARTRRGYAVHRYAANRSMTNRAFYSADGDLVVLPEHGALDILTELGPLHVAPGAIAILPRGIVFSVQLRDAEAGGYIGEPFGRHFRLPERGPVGANGLADARHFRAPAPWFEDRLAPDFRVVAKLGGFLHEASQDHSPFDVVAWHGTYAPVVYDLAAFSPVGNTAFDHGDPSIYCVVTAPDELDLIVFPERWDPTTNTFRPPFFHRNVIAEINGIVREPGAAQGPFQPGCVFVTPPLTAHGPSGRAVERTRQGAADDPMHHHGALWFQFESPLAPSPSAWAEPLEDWAATWGSHRAYFDASGSGR